MKKWLFVADIGNSSTSIALFCNEKIIRFSRISKKNNNKKAVTKFIANISSSKQIDDSVLCSVVPSSDKLWISALKQSFGKNPLIVNHKLTLNIAIDYPKPSTIGGDRIANACGAVSRYGTPVIVADFGTALTFDIISKDKKYLGGVIAPGLPLMTDYLAQKTALLPNIRLKGKYGDIGKTTVEAMRIGAKIGYRGIVREIITYLIEKMNASDIKLCATGGFAQWALDDIGMPFIFDPDITLYGLGLIYNLNKKQE